jgi:hypothetical protein
MGLNPTSGYTHNGEHRPGKFMATIDVGHAGKLVRAMGFARNHSSGSDAPTPVRRKARRRTQPLASRECESDAPAPGPIREPAPAREQPYGDDRNDATSRKQE